MAEVPDITAPLFWTAYHSLRRSCSVGDFGIGPIAISEIMAYCDHATITCPVMRERIIRMIGELHAAERAIISGRAKTQP